jgi:hypothetical protein
MDREAGFSAAPVEMTDFWWGEGTGKGNDRSRSPAGMTSKKGNGESNGKSNGNGNGNDLMFRSVWVEKRVSPLRCSQSVSSSGRNDRFLGWG